MIDENRQDYIRSLLKNMSAQDFMNLGVEQVAYIRPIENGEHALYVVCAADGRRLYVRDSFEEAIQSSLSNKLEPVTVH